MHCAHCERCHIQRGYSALAVPNELIALKSSGVSPFGQRRRPLLALTYYPGLLQRPALPFLSHEMGEGRETLRAKLGRGEVGNRIRMAFLNCCHCHRRYHWREIRRVGRGLSSSSPWIRRWQQTDDGVQVWAPFCKLNLTSRDTHPCPLEITAHSVPLDEPLSTKSCFNSEQFVPA